VTTRWRHRSGWPADPGVQPVARPVKKNASVGRVGLVFFSFSPGGGPGFHRPGHSPNRNERYLALTLALLQDMVIVTKYLD
jgi:hypothetical protein